MTRLELIKHHYLDGRKHGYTAIQAYLSAKSHLHFMERLAKTIATHGKRSKAARNAWMTRRKSTR